MPNSVEDIYATLDNVAPVGTFSQLVSARHDDGGACPVVVLITGTTGSFGSATLAKLIESEDISKVYAINRPSMDAIPLLDRQQEALRSRGYNPALALSPKLVLIEAVMTGDNLGIDATRNGEVVVAPLPKNFSISDPRSRFIAQLPTSYTMHGE